MNKFTYWLLPLLAVLYTPLVYAGDSPEVTLKEAKQLYKQADELQGAWRSTQDLIKKTEAALAKGDTAAATKLANRAKAEAKASVTQANDQFRNWSEPPYIHK